jgi:hypothetical protein
MNRKRIIALVFVLLGGMILSAVFDKAPVLPAVLILPSAPLAVKNGRVPDRWIPANWTWLHRVSRFLFGPPKRVGYTVSFIVNSEAVDSIVNPKSLGQPLAQSNGLAIWIVPDNLLQRPWSTADLVATSIGQPNIDNAERLSNSRCRIGDGEDGYSETLYSRLGKETADLWSRLVVTSWSQTNCIAAVRSQLPYGRALFILGVRQPGSESNRFGFLITADEYDAKGNKVQRTADGK